MPNADLAAAFTDPDRDGRRLYWLSDLGPGDAFRLPAITHYSRYLPPSLQ